MAKFQFNCYSRLGAAFKKSEGGGGIRPGLKNKTYYVLKFDGVFKFEAEFDVFLCFLICSSITLFRYFVQENETNGLFT